MSTEWNQVKEVITNGWIIGPAVFVLWLFAAFILKVTAYRLMARVAVKSGRKWHDLAFSSINMPMQIFVIFIGLTIMSRIMPIGEEAAKYVSYASKIIMIVLGIVIADRLMRVLLIVLDYRAHAVHFSQGVIQGVLRGIVFVVGVLVLLGSMDVNITPLLASLGVTSLAVALALQGTLANLFSGLFLTMDPSIKVGDLVELENGERGYIEEIGWRSSRVRLRSDNIEIIPNSRLVDSVVMNYSGPETPLRIYVRCGVHYDSDLKHVQEVAMEVTRNVMERMKKTVDGTFEPRLRYEEFADSSINFCIVMRVRGYRASLEVKSEMIVSLHERFRSEGIVIPFPMRTLDIQPRHEELLQKIGCNPG